MKRLGGLSAALVVATALMAGPALADTIDFGGNNGGTVSYAGGANPLVGAGLPISTVFGTPPGSGSSTGVSNGSLNFATGNYSSGMDLGGGQFLSFFSAGGSILIAGAVPSAGITTTTTLLQGTFSGMPIFQYAGSGLASLNASLSLTYLSSALSGYFGFGPLTGTGVIAQADLGITFYGTPGLGVPFSGSQSSVHIAVNSAPPVSVPEGSSLLLLASGLSAFGLVRIGLAGKRWVDRAA